MELFRDRRTLMSVIVGPLLITPLLMAAIGMMVSGQVEKAKTRTHRVALVGVENAPELSEALTTTLSKPEALVSAEPMSRTDAENGIRDRKLNAALVIPPGADAELDARHSVSILVLADQGDETSLGAANRLSAIIDRFGDQVVSKRLADSRLPADFATPFHVKETPIVGGRGMSTIFFSRMLPYLLIISAFTGSIYAAFDQVAGEKERGTLETLLVSPASRGEIVIGKFITVTVMCLISSALAIAGFIIPCVSGMKAYQWISQGGLQLSPAAIGITLLMMLPLAVLFAGLLLALSTFARNQKEAQTYIGPILSLIILPAMASMFIDSQVGRQIAFVPILGTSMIIKQALSGSYDPVFIVLAFAASVGWAALALTIATRLFQKESVLIKA